MKAKEPVQEFFSIGDVCTLTDLKPHVLRYWESQFKFLHPAKNRSGNRVYQRREIELVMLVKQLLYTEKYTIDGARQKIDEFKKNGELRAAASLATLFRARGRPDDAITCLQPVYDRFTEGFGTADLIAAKRLLDDLRDAGREPVKSDCGR